MKVFLIYSKEVASQLKMACFCGNISEPSMNKNLPQMLKWFRKQNPDVFLEVWTNGGVQSPEWWKTLGEIIGPNGNIIFGIDGLEDTNHIYRIGVKWNKVIENAKAYISSGAKCTWQFIPFKHNQHQVEQAEQLSKDMGFTNFKIKLSHRHLLNQPRNPSNTVEPADDPRYMHPGKSLDLTNFKDTERYLDSVDINCYAIDSGNIFINSDGLVFPCCYIASIFFLDDNMYPGGYNWINPAKDKFDRTEISLYHHSVEDIINSKTFMKIKESWNLKMAAGRNPVCAAMCGKCSNNNSLQQFNR